MKRWLIFISVFITFFSCTKDPKPPHDLSFSIVFLNTKDAENITNNSAYSGGEIFNDGGSPISARGVCWATSHNPTLSNSFTNNGSGLGIFSSSLSGLTAGTVYYVRAYASNSSGTTYGNEVIFSTTPATEASITTSSIVSISQTSAISGGEIINDGGAPITARGVCWSEFPNPTLSDFFTNDGIGAGTYASSLIGLTAGKRYYVRAYATNSVGTKYGNLESFITSSPNLPTITTSIVGSILQNTATSGGSVTNDGGAPITSRGVCWNTLGYPTISDFTTNNGSGLGSFNSFLTGLTAGNRYYVRAYAINNAGVSYGNQVTFQTNSATLALVTTTSISSITQTNANSGGTITSDGGSPITSRGVCWNTTGNPIIFNSTTINGSGVGSFSSVLSGLNAGTNYYVRAYATNSAGNAYGNEIVFQTSPASLPLLTTNAVNSITQTNANSGGTITSDGGSPITSRGVCWNTTGNPTTSNNTTNNGTGTGGYSSLLTGLSAGTTYYARAYASNSVGTGYGNQISFVTSGTALSAPTLSEPSNGSSTICCYIYYSWTAVAGANSYEFQLSKNSSFPTSGMITMDMCGSSYYPTTVAVNKAISNTTVYCTNTGGSSNNGTWYWRVRALNGSAQGPWSSVFTHHFTW